MHNVRLWLIADVSHAPLQSPLMTQSGRQGHNKVRLRLKSGLIACPGKGDFPKISGLRTPRVRGIARCRKFDRDQGRVSVCQNYLHRIRPVQGVRRDTKRLNAELRIAVHE